MSEAPVYLYTSAGCHLCEKAEELLQQLLGASFSELTLVEVSDSDDLVASYGLRIPVLAGKAADGEWLELTWPFEEKAIRRFFARIEP
ncbi:MAG: glutaredoxin family protein [Pseudohongiellaceae bacterium]